MSRAVNAAIKGSVLRTLATAINIVLWLTFAGCQTMPPELKYSAGQLLEKTKKPMPRCVKEQCELNKDGSLRGCRTIEPFMGMIKDGEACEEEYYAWRDDIIGWHDALVRRYSRDAASAPACIRQRTIPRSLFEIAGVNPDALDATAQALARGAVVPFDSQCMAEVCRWRKQVEPREHSPYCDMASRNLAAKRGAEAQSD